MSDPRIVVITGASSGIGLEAAIGFSQRGDTVVATMRDLERAGPLRQAAAAAGVEPEIAQFDVTDSDQCDALFTDVLDRHGRVDVLVCNAGIGMGGSLEELSVDDIARTMDVNFYGVVRATKAVLPSMRERGSGRLIAVSSVGGAVGQPFTDAYCASKHALEGLYESLQPVAARFGVAVSIVEPGPVATEFNANTPNDVDDPANGLPAYAELRARQRAFMAPGKGRAQSPSDAGQVIIDVASADKPLLRYQTSSFTTRLVGMKLADLDGAGVTGWTSGWFDVEPDE
jgi:NAD(P)-dependent dehydrogenase (short-subunit alcohol dehydrogenase family)